jgi:hypothetical protein
MNASMTSQHHQHNVSGGSSTDVDASDDFMRPNPYRFSPEQVKSTKAILRAFQEGFSQSTAGKMDYGKNKLLV